MKVGFGGDAELVALREDDVVGPAIAIGVFVPNAVEGVVVGGTTRNYGVLLDVGVAGAAELEDSLRCC